jgi:hypothetical protein
MKMPEKCPERTDLRLQARKKYKITQRSGVNAYLRPIAQLALEEVKMVEENSLSIKRLRLTLNA